MLKFLVNNTFQFAGNVRRDGSVLEITKAELTTEIEKGKHKKTGKPLSGLLNHCSPADEETAEFMASGEAKKEVVAEKEEDEEGESAKKELDALRDGMDALGVAYDRRWGREKLSNELKKAKIIKGV